MPESYNKGQGLDMTKVDILPDTCDKYYLCLKEWMELTRILLPPCQMKKERKGTIFSSQKPTMQNLTGTVAFVCRSALPGGDPEIY